jgi:hypothetical protein
VLRCNIVSPATTTVIDLEECLPMARTSRAKDDGAARPVEPKPSVKRAPPPRRAKPIAAAPEAAQPPAAEPVAPADPATTAAPLESPESSVPAARAEISAPPASEPEPVADRAAPETQHPVETAADDAGTPAAVGKPEPAPHVDAILPRPLAAPDPTAMFRAGRTLVEGSIRVRSQMIGFGCRQAEHGLAVGRAMLASGSLQAALALQAEYLGQAVDDALAQTLELSRLSSDVVRAGLESLRPR